jgi:hypothetical protein
MKIGISGPTNRNPGQFLDRLQNQLSDSLKLKARPVITEEEQIIS